MGGLRCRALLLGLLGACALALAAQGQTSIRRNERPAVPLPGASPLAPAGTARPSTVPPTADFQSDEAERRRANAWTVGLTAGLLEGTYIRFAAELAVVLNKEDDLRVLPIVTPGAIQNIKDLLYLRGVDVTITQSDVLEYFQKVERIPNLANRISYISRLYHSEVHIFARSEFQTIQDLAGKRVNLHQPGTAPTLTGRIVFDRLGVSIQASYLNNAIAIEKMKNGEIDALVHVTSKPNDLFTKFKGEGFRFIPVPFSEKFADLYLPTDLTASDYPSFIPAGQKVDTLAVSTILAAYDWPENTERYQHVSRFVERLFEKFAELQKPPFHPKWRDVNLAGTIPGWRRHQAVERIVRQLATSNEPNALRVQFDDFLRQRGGSTVANFTPQMRDALFRDFVEFMALRSREGAAARQ
jgi:TRAP-type uncharacterized transport system substrate-binding protein